MGGEEVSVDVDIEPQTGKTRLSQPSLRAYAIDLRMVMSVCVCVCRKAGLDGRRTSKSIVKENGT